MDTRTYQDFAIASESRGPGVCWFGVTRNDGAHFEFSLHIAPPNPAMGDEPVDRDEFAQAFGARWVHGMIDLDRYQNGRLYREIRAPEWNPAFGKDDLSDQDLGDELLIGLARLHASEGPLDPGELDLEGIAVVLNIGIERVLTVMKDLSDRGLVARRDGDMGAHVITDAGLDYMAANRVQRKW